MGGFTFPGWMISGTLCASDRGPQPQAEERLPHCPQEIWVLVHPGLFPSEPCTQPILGPPMVSAGSRFGHTRLAHIFKTISCRKLTDVWAGGGHQRHFLQSWRPSHCPLGRQKLTGITEMTYGNTRTIWTAKLLQLIFILIAAAGILIHWHPELLLCH